MHDKARKYLSACFMAVLEQHRDVVIAMRTDLEAFRAAVAFPLKKYIRVSILLL